MRRHLFKEKKGRGKINKKKRKGINQKINTDKMRCYWLNVVFKPLMIQHRDTPKQTVFFLYSDKPSDCKL